MSRRYGSTVTGRLGTPGRGARIYYLVARLGHDGLELVFVDLPIGRQRVSEMREIRGASVAAWDQERRSAGEQEGTCPSRAIDIEFLECGCQLLQFLLFEAQGLHGRHLDLLHLLRSDDDVRHSAARAVAPLPRNRREVVHDHANKGRDKATFQSTT